MQQFNQYANQVLSVQSSPETMAKPKPRWQNKAATFVLILAGLAMFIGTVLPWSTAPSTFLSIVGYGVDMMTTKQNGYPVQVAISGTIIALCALGVWGRRSLILTLIAILAAGIAVQTAMSAQVGVAAANGLWNMVNATQEQVVIKAGPGITLIYVGAALTLVGALLPLIPSTLRPKAQVTA